MAATRKISDIVNDETKIVGWKTKTSSEKSISIYDILNENKFSDNHVDELTEQLIELAKRNL